jgi:molybdate transport system substrate-binding protein
MKRALMLLCLGAWWSASGLAADAGGARVFAAASLTTALTDLAGSWQKSGHPAPILDFAASGTLAKQIEAGAPADLFASADLTWMDYLDTRGKIDHATRSNLLSTTLVLIAPNDQHPKIEMTRNYPIANAFTGKLCTGEPGVVPVGIYAKQALESLGWWPTLQDRIVGTDDVRTALAFVERGECTLGIVYATDAMISTKVHVVAEFPADTHPPILYPFALIPGASPEGRAFLQYLSSPQAAALFRHYGFAVLSK